MISAFGSEKWKFLVVQVHWNVTQMKSGNVIVYGEVLSYLGSKGNEQHVFAKSYKKYLTKIYIFSSWCLTMKQVFVISRRAVWSFLRYSLFLLWFSAFAHTGVALILSSMYTELIHLDNMAVMSAGSHHSWWVMQQEVGFKKSSSCSEEVLQSQL